MFGESKCKYCSKPAPALRSPFQPHFWPCSPQEGLPSSNTSFISCLHLLFLTLHFAHVEWLVYSTGLRKWRTSKVSKYLNMVMLHSEIIFFSLHLRSVFTLSWKSQPKGFQGINSCFLQEMQDLKQGSPMFLLLAHWSVSGSCILLWEICVSHQPPRSRRYFYQAELLCQEGREELAA